MLNSTLQSPLQHVLVSLGVGPFLSSVLSIFLLWPYVDSSVIEGAEELSKNASAPLSLQMKSPCLHICQETCLITPFLYPALLAVGFPVLLCCPHSQKCQVIFHLDCLLASSGGIGKGGAESQLLPSLVHLCSMQGRQGLFALLFIFGRC